MSENQEKGGNGNGEQAIHDNPNDPVRDQFQGCLCAPACEKAYVLKTLFTANEGNKHGYFNSDPITNGIAWILDEIMWTMEQADKYIEELQAQVKAAGNGGAA